jgi:hypothetical protein
MSQGLDNKKTTGRSTKEDLVGRWNNSIDTK